MSTLAEAIAQLLHDDPTSNAPVLKSKLAARFPDATTAQIRHKIRKIRDKMDKQQASTAASTATTAEPASHGDATDGGLVATRKTDVPCEKFIIDAFEVVDMPGKGKGVIATRDILYGEIILKEKPVLFFSDHMHERLHLSKKEVVLSCAADVQAIFDNLDAHQKKEVASLADCFATTDSTKTPAGIYFTNCVPRGPSGRLGGVLCPLTSRFNHSCSPNACFQWRSEEECESVCAIRAMKKGEEICVKYIHVLAPRDERRAILEEGYHFSCQCDTCGLHESNPERAKISDANRTAIAQIDQEVPRVSISKQFDMALRMVERMVKLVEDEGLMDPVWRARTAGDAFQLSVYSGKPTSVLKKWATLAYTNMVMSHGSRDSTALKYMAFAKKPPTLHELMRSHVHQLLSGK
eukprot:GEMP01039678.1.p1 GENE.GEMP01039678.1~~GEMP01039678.1.p1  ORF type:complete len:408 (+),score=74.43 GEMP01039678.1:66-1289(+)